MMRLSNRLRVGEKIGFSFGLVGLLFLGVIWQYQHTLDRSLADYQHLQDVLGAKKDLALEIENSMLEARRAEKGFLLYQDEELADEVARHVARTRQLAAELGRIGEQNEENSLRIDTFAKTYHQRFQATAEAWRTKGLDHDSGLQGAFRDSIHELEEMAGQLEVGGLYLQLLQIRRGEKDLGLRRERQYSGQVLDLIGGFGDKIDASRLSVDLKEQLHREIETYRDAFHGYSRAVLTQQDIHGGKGPFREAAHRIETLLNTHYVPDLERGILQLRRREKDYLLRGDKRYADMAVLEVQIIHEQLEMSSIDEHRKQKLAALLDKYQRDFLVLVAQNDRIASLKDAMHEAVLEIASLAADNVKVADRKMSEVAAQIHASSQNEAQLMLWVSLAATLLGIFFAVVITGRITRPLLHMAELLNRLAYEEPVERVPETPGGRDEVNAMAESVNTMADHRTRFLGWWKASIEEADARQQLHKATAEPQGPDSAPAVGLHEARKEFKDAQETKDKLLADMHHDVRAHAQRIVEASTQLAEGPGSANRQLKYAGAVDQSAKQILSTLSVILGHEPAQETASRDTTDLP